ncbi:MAG: hypothetical protein JST66_11800 [Bacteroidetes bacterium]|nr:hypothetical protein [Bacteroidota bacterium]
MTEDTIYLLLCYVLLGITMTASVLKRPDRSRTIGIHIGILLAYSLPLLYALHFRSTEGTALGWLIYLMVAIGIHWAVIVIGLVRSSCRS